MDGWPLVWACAASAGAAWAAPVPRSVAGAGVVLAVVFRRPLLLTVALVLLAAGVGRVAWEGLAPPPPGDFAGAVVLRSDPERVRGAVTAVVTTAHGRVEVWARGAAGRAIEQRLAGESVAVEGRLGPLPASRAGRLHPAHVRGTLAVERVGEWSPGSPLSRAANRVRRLLERGAASLPPTERALFTGFVHGDDRRLPEGTADAFRAAGLSHLTAVSGQNVAFLLALAGPLLVRLAWRTRLAVTVGLVAWFALLTRFEPSVLRASGMAALAVVAVAADRPASGVRLLGLTCTAFVLVDPLLVHRVGWWLSVAATAGILLLGPVLQRRLPGPASLRAALAVPLAAQLATAPVLVLVFGSVPWVALPANVLAEPLVAPVMVLGVPAALVSAAVPALGPVLLLPVRLCLRWILLVATVGAAV